MFKPLLAATADFDKLTFPKIASPKVDGIRCVIDPDHGAVSRTMKPIPNDHIRGYLNFRGLNGLDGELVTFTNGKLDDFNTIQGNVMRKEGTPEFAYMVFDDFTYPTIPYNHRIERLKEVSDSFGANVQLVPTIMVHNLEQLAKLESAYIDDQGWEGVMLRRPMGPYKFGRSTVNEGILLKVKRFTDDEAVITGRVERMHNGNEATKDAFGRTERSSHKANMTPTGTLGALKARWEGIDFEIGTGFDDATRQALWDERDLVGHKVTFKFQGVGSLGAPRFPVFLGIRRDL